MYFAYSLIAALIFIPASAHAQGIESYLTNFIFFIDGVLIPFLFGMAFLLFVINAVRFFVLESSNKEGREKARKLIMYSLLAFVFLVIFLGFINILTGSLGLDDCNAPVSDYQRYNFTGPMPPGC